MNLDDKVIAIDKLIRATRSTAKFVHVSHSSQFISDVGYPDNQHFFHVSIYDEYIDSHYLKKQDDRILVINTYAGSFIYNIALSFYYSLNRQNQDVISRNKELEGLLKYNLKKFYAEQLYNYKNCVFSRAIFLETLVYEQHRMIPVFRSFESEVNEDQMVETIKQIGCNIFGFHEMGHHFFNDTEYHWNHELSQELREIFVDVVANWKRDFSEKELLELRCDFLALVACMNAHKSRGTANMIILSYYAMAILYSLKLSAEQTIKDIIQAHPKESIDFQNISSQDPEIIYTLTLDAIMVERARMLVLMCERIAKQRQMKLYEECDNLPISRNTEEILTNLMEVILESENPNERAISRLLAESMHDHEDGMKYLYLRSKVFKSNRETLKI